MADTALTLTERKGLKERGLWGVFLSRREELEREGLTRGAAERAAIKDCGGGTAVRKTKALDVAPDGLGGRTATEAAMIRWVAENVDNARARPDDCPAAFAWTLLRRCRESSQFLDSFIEKLWTRLIPSKSGLDPEAGKPVEVDDAGVIDMTLRIQHLRDKAEKGSR